MSIGSSKRLFDTRLLIDNLLLIIRSSEGINHLLLGNVGSLLSQGLGI